MAALLLCYHFTALCASKDDCSASAICYLRWLFLVHYYISRLAASVVLPIVFILSANDSEVDDCGDEHTLLWHSILL